LPVPTWLPLNVCWRQLLPQPDGMICEGHPHAFFWSIEIAAESIDTTAGHGHHPTVGARYGRGRLVQPGGPRQWRGASSPTRACCPPVRGGSPPGQLRGLSKQTPWCPSCTSSCCGSGVRGRTHYSGLVRSRGHGYRENPRSPPVERLGLAALGGRAVPRSRGPPAPAPARYGLGHLPGPSVDQSTVRVCPFRPGRSRVAESRRLVEPVDRSDKRRSLPPDHVIPPVDHRAADKRKEIAVDARQAVPPPGGDLTAVPSSGTPGSGRRCAP
jgi:hypothetical protein